MKRSFLPFLFVTILFFSNALKAQVNTTDSLALLALYNSTDGANWVTPWDLNQPVSTWNGVFVTSSRVTTISLFSENLTGDIPPEIGNLTALTNLSLGINNLSGSLPAEIGGLSSLTNLNLLNNDLSGSIPPEIGALTSLTALSFTGNDLTGSIPTEIGNLSNLIFLRLDNNELTGGIPLSVWSLTSLTHLELNRNSLTGTIPQEIINLSSLQILRLSENDLSGSLPVGIWSLSSLTNFELNQNSLTGTIPQEVANLSSLQILNLSDNDLSGSLPAEIGSLPILQLFLEDNQFSGTIPAEFSNLTNATWIHLSDNNLSGDVPNQFADLTSLEFLLLSGNQLETLPDLSGLSNLTQISVSANKLEFDDLLPNAALFLSEFEYNQQATIGDPETFKLTSGQTTQFTVTTPDDNTNEYQWYVDFEVIDGAAPFYDFPSNGPAGNYHCEITNPALPGLTLRSNPFTVSYPLNETDSLALVALYNSTAGENWNNAWDLTEPATAWDGVTIDAGRVTSVRLGRNNLVGSLPAEIGNLTKLTELNLFNNQLVGVIPSEIGDLAELTSLYMGRNSFSGSIPTELWSLLNLESLNLSNGTGIGGLDGTIPSEISQLSQLSRLDLRNNDLTGEILVELSTTLSLVEIDLAGNEFNGTIPPTLVGLTNLTKLDLEGNNLSGNIPLELGTLPNITFLSLGSNELIGEVPIELGDLATLLTLNLQNNILTGAIPAELANLTSLVSLVLSGNQLSGEVPNEFTSLPNLGSLIVGNNNLNSLPDFSAHPTLNELFVYENKFEFDDLLPNAAIFTNSFQYESMGNINEELHIGLNKGDEVLLSVETPDDGTNQYQWYNNGNEIEGEVSPTFQLNSEIHQQGNYYCTVTNASLPGLTITRNNIYVSFQLSQADSLALISLYNSTDGPNWTNTWDLTQPVASWHGVTASGGQVTSISLSSNSLVGSIPEEIGNLASLEDLDLSNNELTGTIPEEIYNLSSLSSLLLPGNKLTGEVAAEIGNLSLLKVLNLGRNHFNSIPLEIGNLSLLKTLDLSNLPLNEGSVLFDFSLLTQLAFLNLGSSNFSGSVSSSIGSTALSYLYLGGNKFTGTLPSEIGQLTSLQSLFIPDNEFSGEIPSTFENLIALENFWAHNNNLSGAIPEGFSSLPLGSVLLYNNHLSTLPAFSVGEIRDFFVQNNNFEFDDLIPNASLFNSSSDYSPQAKIDGVEILNPEEEENVTLLVDTNNDGNNTYQWFKDNNPVDGATSDLLTFSYSSTEDVGIYHCEVSNPALPELFLVRKNIFIGLDITPVNPEDSLGLRKLYDATSGESWSFSSRWFLDDPISQFEGVEIANERVTELNLFNSGFSGYASVPEELLLLDSLSILDLRFNDIRSIPDFSELKTIDQINISQNALPVWDIARINGLTELGVDLSYDDQENLVDQIDQIAAIDEQVTLTATFAKTELQDGGSNAYQWYRDGELLSSETDSVLTISYSDTDAGIYQCVVTHPDVENVETQSNEVRLNVVPSNITLSNKTIRESLSIATEIGLLSTIDPEVDDSHTYELIGSTDFFIADNSLRSNVVFDHATQSNYFITVKSTDARGLIIERSFSIDILEEVKFETTVAEFPGNGRSGAVSFQLGEDVFIGLGNDADSTYKDFWIYDASEEAWELIADFPGDARANSIAFVLGGKGYVGLGNGDSFSTLFSDFYQLDPSDNSWSQVSDFGGSARYSAVSFVANEFAFVGTGKDATDETKDFWQYDASGDIWTQVADLNATQRNGAFGFSISDKGYVGGGVYVDDDFFTEVFSDIQEYDPITNTWTEKVFADINLSFINATSTATEKLAYIFYGNKEKVVTYDPMTNEIQDLGDEFSLGFDRSSPISFEFANKIYFGLGSYTMEVFGDPIYPTDFHTIQLSVEVPNVSPSDIFLDNMPVDENIAGGKVGDLYSIDGNAADTHVLELVTGEGDTDNSRFTINNQALNFSEAFNFEEQSEYSVRIRTTDDHDTSFEKVFVISVNDINEEPTDISLSNVEVLEKQSVDTFIGTLATIDEDTEDLHTYEIISGADEFSLTENGLYSKVSFDFLTQSSYSVRIQTTDLLGKLFQKTFVITVLSANEVPTDITLSNIEISENEEANILIGELSTVDANTEDVHTYELIDTNSSFYLVENQVFTSVSFDFEAKEAHALTITSTDLYGASFEKEFTISIIDEEDPLGADGDFSKTIEIYPNPAKEFLTIKWNNDFRGEAQGHISDASGKVVQEIQFLKNQQRQHISIDISHLLQGVYFINMKSANHRTTKRLIKVDN